MNLIIIADRRPSRIRQFGSLIHMIKSDIHNFPLTDTLEFARSLEGAFDFEVAWGGLVVQLQF